MAKWQADWPVDSGYYWFYGWLFATDRQTGRPKELRMVEVMRSGGDRPVYMTNGTFIYNGNADGVWMQAVLPKPPRGG